MSSELLTLGRLPRGAVLEAGHRPCSSSLHCPPSGREAPGPCYSPGRPGEPCANRCSTHPARSHPREVRARFSRWLQVPVQVTARKQDPGGSWVLRLVPSGFLFPGSLLSPCSTCFPSPCACMHCYWQLPHPERDRVADPGDKGRPGGGISNHVSSCLLGCASRFPPSSARRVGENLMLAASAPLQNRKKRGSRYQSPLRAGSQGSPFGLASSSFRWPVVSPFL